MQYLMECLYAGKQTEKGMQAQKHTAHTDCTACKYRPLMLTYTCCTFCYCIDTNVSQPT